MMRLPYFAFHAPATVREAAERLAAPGGAMLVAGGTDLLPNMKRRQQVPPTLVGLRRVAELKTITYGAAQSESPSIHDGVTIGSGVTLATLVRDARIREEYAGLWQAVAQVATPHLRNMGTIGGNLCLDTRCNYYDQNYEWRKAIDFCMKKDGETCWVATSSPKCLAVSSSDSAPVLLALGAEVTLVSAESTRRIPVSTMYQNDGIHYLTKRPAEILTAVHLPRLDGWRSTYWKLRRRGAFDFPVLGVAAAAKMAADGTVEDARIVLGAVASRPIVADLPAHELVGRRLTDEVVAEAAERTAQLAKPMDNTDFALVWRKRVARDFVAYALRELRGEDMSQMRRKTARLIL
jgi:4-hydroxybenzoyl-CoA reductase subunit beta